MLTIEQAKKTARDARTKIITKYGAKAIKSADKAILAAAKKGRQFCAWTHEDLVLIDLVAEVLRDRQFKIEVSQDKQSLNIYW